MRYSIHFNECIEEPEQWEYDVCKVCGRRDCERCDRCGRCDALQPVNNSDEQYCLDCYIDHFTANRGRK